jgi:hypothetical protein
MSLLLTSLRKELLGGRQAKVTASPVPLIWRIIMALKRALPPTHPGEILREDVLPAMELSVMDAAAKLCVTRQMLHRIIARAATRGR